jgi:ApbE superfamily uncharacterized protein (UPF0280 family)
MEPAAVSPGWRKSSYSDNGGSSCVEVSALPWRKSSYSDNGGDSCVEVSAVPRHPASSVLVRDTTERGGGRVLRVPEQAWRAFTSAVRAGSAIS